MLLLLRLTGHNATIGCIFLVLSRPKMTSNSIIVVSYGTLVGFHAGLKRLRPFRFRFVILRSCVKGRNKQWLLRLLEHMLSLGLEKRG